MHGKLILIGGLSGSGKTTLMRAAAAVLAEVQVLQTTTTRPIRPGEHDGEEYVFVSDAEYEIRRAASSQWDHLEYNGFKYGADATAIVRRLKAGIHIICTVTPDPDEITMLERAYDTPATTIWLDVPVETAHERIAGDAVRASRIESIDAKRFFQHHFTPSGTLADDKVAFARFVRQLL